MEINWFIIIIIAVCAVILIVYLIRKNQKDKEKVVKEMNNEYTKSDETESESNNEGDEDY